MMVENADWKLVARILRMYCVNIPNYKEWRRNSHITIPEWNDDATNRKKGIKRINRLIRTSLLLDIWNLNN